MTSEERRKLSALVALDIAVGWKVDQLIDLLTDENIDEVMGSIPADLHNSFVDLCLNVFDLDNNPTAISIPDDSAERSPESLSAVKGWLSRNGHGAPLRGNPAR